MYNLTKRQFGLYVILTDPVTGYATCARAAVRAGIRYLQLRMKNVSTTVYIKTAAALREITRGTGTLFIVNDNLEVAVTVDADGIHLGQNDLPVPLARREWQQPGKIFGLSTHSPAQAAAAAEIQPDYIGVGPVFTTPTKAIPDPVLGVQVMQKIIHNTSLPAVAIGGINRSNLVEVLSHGAVNFSSVRPVTQSNHPYRVIRELQAEWARQVLSPTNRD